MGDINNSLNTSVTVVNGCLIVTLPNYISDDEIEKGISRILMTTSKPSIRGVILDFSMISALESYWYKILEKVSKTISLMGTAIVWVGLRPGVVSSLLDLNVDISCIKAAIDLEQAISMILHS